MTSTAMMERSSRWARRAAGRARTASRLSAGFPKLQFWFQTSGAWKKISSKLIHGMMKNANVYRKEGWETGKYRMYRNVSECIGEKMELYMYNSKKMELYMYNSKKMELYIPIHSYTSHLFRRFWGRGFWKSIVCLAFVWPKNAAPWAAIVEIKQFT